MYTYIHIFIFFHDAIRSAVHHPGPSARAAGAQPRLAGEGRERVGPPDNRVPPSISIGSMVMGV